MTRTPRISRRDFVHQATVTGVAIGVSQAPLDLFAQRRSGNPFAANGAIEPVVITNDGVAAD